MAAVRDVRGALKRDVVRDVAAHLPLPVAGPSPRPAVEGDPSSAWLEPDGVPLVAVLTRPKDDAYGSGSLGDLDLGQRGGTAPAARGRRRRHRRDGADALGREPSCEPP